MDFRVYYGGAGGSAQKALRKLEIPNVLISFATSNNRPWDGIENLAVDSGGFSVLYQSDVYETPVSEYLEHLKRHESILEWFALRDYPVAPELLEKHGRTVADHQRLTTEAHLEVITELEECRIDADRVAVVQGSTPNSYQTHVDQLRDRGVLSAVDRVGVGSLVGTDPDEVARILVAVREAVPSKYPIHGFGINRSDLRYRETLEAVDSIDSCTYERTARNEAPEGISCDWKHVLGYLAGYRETILKIRNGNVELKTVGSAGQSDLSEY